MASKGVNKVILLGNVGKDPEVRDLPNGGTVANITLATSKSWKDKTTGEKVDKTEWHNLSFFGKLGEIVGQYVTKGSKIYVEGELETRKYQAQDGSDRYSTSIICNEMQMLDKKGEGEGVQGQSHAPQASRADAAMKDYATASGGTTAQAAATLGTPAQAAAEAFDDDIPF